MSDPQKPQAPAAPLSDVKLSVAAKPAPAGALKLATPPSDAQVAPAPAVVSRKPEIGGPKGPEPTRYGDWEKSGRCVDF
jgi:hypothetical protein